MLALRLGESGGKPKRRKSGWSDGEPAPAFRGVSDGYWNRSVATPTAWARLLRGSLHQPSDIAALHGYLRRRERLLDYGVSGPNR